SSGLVAIELVASTGPDTLAWVENGAGPRLKLADPGGGALGELVLPEPPIDLVIGPGGHHAYVLMQPASGAAQAVAVDLHHVLAGIAPATGAAAPLGEVARALALAGKRLLVSW